MSSIEPGVMMVNVRVPDQTIPNAGVLASKHYVQFNGNTYVPLEVVSATANPNTVRTPLIGDFIIGLDIIG